MSHRLVALSVLMLMSLGRFAFAQGADSQNDRRGVVANRDLICGPRCVQYVLAHFSVESDVIDLTREIQGPDLEAGASLDAIATALERRGLHTFAMHIEKNQRLDWEHPVIFHVNGEDSEVGHFQVWLPTNGAGRDEIWDGLSGRVSLSHSEWAASRSGAVLLISPTVIASPQRAIVTRPGFRRFAGVSLALGGGFGLSVCFFLKFRRSG